jgi:hypothetical protein
MADQYLYRFAFVGEPGVDECKEVLADVRGTEAAIAAGREFMDENTTRDHPTYEEWYQRGLLQLEQLRDPLIACVAVRVDFGCLVIVG